MSDPGYTPPPEFLCPLCGSNQCHFTFYRSPAGKVTRMPWFSCAGCTVMFRDPRRFQVLMRRTAIDGAVNRATQVEEVPGIGKPAVAEWNKRRSGA